MTQRLVDGAQRSARTSRICGRRALSALRAVAIAISRRTLLSVALPALEVRTCYALRRFANPRHFLLRERLKLLRDPDVVFNLADGRATHRQAMNRQAEHIREAVFEVQFAQQSRIAWALHRLDSDAALNRNRQHHLLEAQVRRVGRI